MDPTETELRSAERQRIIDELQRQAQEAGPDCYESYWLSAAAERVRRMGDAQPTASAVSDTSESDQRRWHTAVLHHLVFTAPAGASEEEIQSVIDSATSERGLIKAQTTLAALREQRLVSFAASSALWYASSEGVAAANAEPSA